MLDIKKLILLKLLDRISYGKNQDTGKKYGEHMYTSETPDEKIFAIKPMNCPGCMFKFLIKV